jgi:hypothetical protein
MKPFDDELGFVTVGVYVMLKQGFVDEFKGVRAPALDFTKFGP